MDGICTEWKEAKGTGTIPGLRRCARFLLCKATQGGLLPPGQQGKTVSD